jgi:hypothetical protein
VQNENFYISGQSWVNVFFISQFERELGPQKQLLDIGGRIGSLGLYYLSTPEEISLQVRNSISKV